jgi:hypothetical protein
VATHFSLDAARQTVRELFLARNNGVGDNLLGDKSQPDNGKENRP